MSTIVNEVARLPWDAQSESAATAHSLFLSCPGCHAGVGFLSPNETSTPKECPSCGFMIRRVKGIWRAMTPSSEDKFRQFVREYQAIRLKEARGAGGAHYFLALPYKDVTGRNSWQWKIRGRSFRHLERIIFPQLEKQFSQPMDILDVGAGNCWMSYRLAQRGHRAVAVDLVDNDLDGLSAARHYLSFLRGHFPRFQAEMDCLPFARTQFDLVVFNASLHYSECYSRTLKEALRCLRRPGHVLIVDSPFYSCESSGRAMVEEKRAQFEKRFGFRSNSIASQEFLTRDILECLGKQHGIRWEFHEPWYGLGWAMRPWRAKILGRREPAKFLIASGEAA
ncbi:MAG TPA: class I SAM-dependent methyltransferase [Terriglobia bacterium]|nr:class I SAM-dependent methyltransferase [Terriglobia bacterium]